jgi:heterodisulfide reductase subunit A
MLVPALQGEPLPWREGDAATLPYNFNLITSAGGTPLVTANCLTCHADLPEISASHPVASFGCVSCHGGERLALDADLLTLSAAVVPAATNPEVARLFKVTVNTDGFFQEAHVKLRPVDFAADGVFMCGSSHYPKHLTEALSHAHGAAGRAVTLLSQDTVTASGSVCEVEEDECVSCGACITACAYGAIEFRDTAKGKKAFVNPVLCKGDGLCCAKCPTNAVVLKHFTDEEVFDQIDAALETTEWT